MSATTPAPRSLHLSELLPDGRLIKGNDALLLERLLPHLEQGSLTLDLSGATHLDAAGVAALISLYLAAEHAGHTFRVYCIGGHAAEVLTLLGLNCVLIADNCGKEPILSPAA